MRKKETEKLEELLWKMIKAIFQDGMTGLPPDWQKNRVEDLADIFRPKDLWNKKRNK